MNLQTRWIPFALAVMALLAASACAMQDHAGWNSEEYYKEHPRANKVQQVTRSHVMNFGEAGESFLSGDERQAFVGFLGDTTPEAVEVLELQTASGDKSAPALRKVVQALLADVGLGAKPVHWRQGNDVSDGQVQVSMTALQVVLPDCPDWSQPADINYSNDWHSSMRCASVTNLGRMVADPRDLVHGRGKAGADTATALQAIELFHAGAVGAASSSASSAKSGGAASGSSSSGAASGSSSSGGSGY